MTSDDPFFSPGNDDRTLIRPVPGGQRADLGRRVPGSAPTFSQAAPLPTLGRLNPLEQAASGLLALLTRINLSRSQTNPAELKARIIKEIEQFQQAAQREQVDHDTIMSARYVLCTVLDEAIINTPWSNQSEWSEHSLLSLFHKEVSGGERFFHLLKSLAQNPAANQNLLELMYLCLTLGFEGRYRLVEGGKNKLGGIREWLYQILQKQRGLAETDLSPHWRGVTDRRNPLLKLVPLWVFGALSALILAALYSVLLFRLNNFSDPVFNALNAIAAPKPSYSEPEFKPVEISPVPKLTLTTLLADEIAAKRLSVAESTKRGTVTIQSDNLFASGSATVNPDILPVLERITEAMNQLPGNIQITGHSDNKPIHSLRFPSNWHLSKARAQAVAEVIKPKLTETRRVTIVGKSDLEPVSSNAKPEGRARNRRVEVSLLK